MGGCQTLYCPRITEIIWHTSRNNWTANNNNKINDDQLVDIDGQRGAFPTYCRQDGLGALPCLRSARDRAPALHVLVTDSPHEGN